MNHTYQNRRIETKGVSETHRITRSRTKTKLVNKVHSILLAKYDYQTDLTDIFSKSGIEVAEIVVFSDYTKYQAL